MAMNGDSIPYVVFNDTGAVSKATVMKCSGNSVWTDVGARGFSPSTFTAIAICLNGDTPYVAFGDASKANQLVVMRYNGLTWNNVGAPVGTANAVALALDTVSHIPYVAFQDGQNAGRATVMKFDTAWSLVGQPGISIGMAAFISLQLYNSIPYLAFEDAGANGIYVKYFNGAAWVDLSGGAVVPASSYVSLNIDKCGGVYLAYMDATQADRASAFKYSSPSWLAVGGYLGFTAGTANAISISTGGTCNVPYLAFQDGSQGNRLSVMVFQ
jgi:hypothetical protein